ncbi:MAG: hypothetical protein R2817_04740 [Flavobacteriales bacterium]
MRTLLWPLCALGAALACSACRKEQDRDPPVVRILSPGDGVIVQTPDTLLIEVDVSDDTRLESVTAALTNDDGVPVGSSVSRALQGTSTRVTLALPVVDETYPGGPLTLTVRASDGNNDGRAFRQVDVLAAPLQRLAILLAPSPGTTGIVYRFDPTTGAEAWHGPVDIGPLLATGPNVFLAGTDQGPLQRRSFLGNWSTLAVNGTPASSGRPFFRGLGHAPFDDRVYAGMDDGRVVGYRRSGSQVFNGWSYPGTVSHALLPLADRVVSAAFDEVGNAWRLAEHAYVSGGTLGWRPLDHACIALRSAGGERVLSFGNGNGALAIRSIYMSQGGTISEANVPGTMLNDVTSTATGDHFLATTNGIKRYRTSTGLTDLVGSGHVQSITFDDASGSLWALEDGQLKQVSPNDGTILGTWIVPAGMGQVEVVLNR